MPVGVEQHHIADEPRQTFPSDSLSASALHIESCPCIPGQFLASNFLTIQATFIADKALTTCSCRTFAVATARPPEVIRHAAVNKTRLCALSLQILPTLTPALLTPNLRT